MFRSRDARDTSGPMDIDEAHPLGRVAQYAVNDDGPARKRLHSDLSSPSPFAEPSGHLRFGPSTPFLFHAAAPHVAPVKFEPYDPNRWARADFGFGPAAAAAGGPLHDVEMSDSPARPSASAGGASETALAAETDGAGASQPEPPQTEERPIAGGAVARVRRRRQKEWRRRRESVSDGEGSLRRVAKPQEHNYNFHMPAPAVRHNEIPAILLGYVQLLFNASLVVGFLYVALQFVLAVRRDVHDRIEEYSVEILQEIAGCTNAYLTNRCDPTLRVPAMEAACSAWEICMNRDPTVVGRARVGAETFAGVINSFVEPISWKTMGFTLVTLTFLVVLTNSALFNLRAKHQAGPPAPAPPAPPAYPSAPYGFGFGFGAPGFPPPGLGAAPFGHGHGPGHAVEQPQQGQVPGALTSPEDGWGKAVTA
ncbi:hypothetical protein Q5752_000845 [Cryptotrichosporon argae]